MIYTEFFNFILKNLKFTPVLLLLFSFFFYSLSSYLPYQFQSKSIIKVESTSVKPTNVFQGLIGNESQDKISEVLEIMRSYNFYTNSLYKDEDAAYLIAYKSYDPKLKLDIYDHKIYDDVSDTWLRKESNFKKSKPSLYELWDIFNKKHLKAILNRESSFIELKVIHRSPVYAEEIMTRLLKQLDNYFFIRDLDYYNKLIELVEIEIVNTKNLEAKAMLSMEINENMKKIASMQAKEFYVIKQVEPPFVEENPFSPKLVFLLTISLFLSILSYLLISSILFLRALYKK
jgi:hypothetical protein